MSVVSCSSFVRCLAAQRLAAVTALTRRGMGLLAEGRAMKSRCMVAGLSSGRRRFYKEVSVYKTEEGMYGVQLDHRKLRTPLRDLLLLPTEAMALAVGQEWDCQGSVLQPSIMHLTALCNTVLDNPQQLTTGSRVEKLLKYLETDTVLYRQTEPEDLVIMQTKEWDPIISWFNGRFDTHLRSSTSLQPPSMPVSSLSSLSLFLSQLDKWSLEGFQYAVESSQSLILASALLEGQLDVESATDLSRLETRHQTLRWGSVEWQHDVEYHDLRSRLSAAYLLAQLVNFI